MIEAKAMETEHVQIDLNVHVYLHSDPAPGDVAARVTALEEKVMALVDDMKAGFARVDAATTAVGARLDALAAKLAGGVSAADAGPMVTELNKLGDALEAMAKDPVNPTPVPLPSPAPGT